MQFHTFPKGGLSTVSPPGGRRKGQKRATPMDLLRKPAENLRGNPHQFHTLLELLRALPRAPSALFLALWAWFLVPCSSAFRRLRGYCPMVLGPRSAGLVDVVQGDDRRFHAGDVHGASCPGRRVPGNAPGPVGLTGSWKSSAPPALNRSLLGFGGSGGSGAASSSSSRMVPTRYYLMNQTAVVSSLCPSYARATNSCASPPVPGLAAFW